MAYLWNSENVVKQQPKPKSCKEKEIIKIIAKINEIETENII